MAMTINQENQATDVRRWGGLIAAGGLLGALGLVLLHLAACSVWPRRERSMDRQLHAVSTVPALFHRGDDSLPRLRLLAGLSTIQARLR